MTAYKHSMTSLAEVPSMRISQGRISGGDERTPSLTIGMIVPLFWNGRATRCGARR